MSFIFRHLTLVPLPSFQPSSFLSLYLHLHPCVLPHFYFLSTITFLISILVTSLPSSFFSLYLHLHRCVLPHFYFLSTIPFLISILVTSLPSSFFSLYLHLHPCVLPHFYFLSTIPFLISILVTFLILTCYDFSFLPPLPFLQFSFQTSIQSSTVFLLL